MYIKCQFKKVRFGSTIQCVELLPTVCEAPGTKFFIFLFKHKGFDKSITI